MSTWSNWIVVERRIVRELYKAMCDKQLITGIGTEVNTSWGLLYQSGIQQYETWYLLYHNIIVEDEFPEYKRCKEAVVDKTIAECSNARVITGICSLTLNPAIHRYFDREKYGFWILKRQFCLEHFLMSATIFLICSGAVKFLEWVIGHFL